MEAHNSGGEVVITAELSVPGRDLTHQTTALHRGFHPKQPAQILI
jgi:hypothetical protein